MHERVNDSNHVQIVLYIFMRMILFFRPLIPICYKCRILYSLILTWFKTSFITICLFLFIISLVVLCLVHDIVILFPFIWKLLLRIVYPLIKLIHSNILDFRLILNFLLCLIFWLYRLWNIWLSEFNQFILTFKVRKIIISQLIVPLVDYSDIVYQYNTDNDQR